MLLLPPPRNVGNPTALLSTLSMNSAFWMCWKLTSLSLSSQEVLPPPEEPDAEGNPEAGLGNEVQNTPAQSMLLML